MHYCLNISFHFRNVGRQNMQGMITDHSSGLQAHVYNSCSVFVSWETVWNNLTTRIQFHNDDNGFFI